jgi:hypothetical protein
VKTEYKPIRSRTKQYIIGGARYNVTSTFSETAKEPLEQKLLKFISDRIAVENKKPKSAVI